MARCNFCGTTFESKQGVRAHLKGCAAYKTHRQAKGSGELPTGYGSKASEPREDLPIRALPVVGSETHRQQVLPRQSLTADTAQQITSPNLGSRLDHGAVDVVLRVNEDLRSLRQDLIEALDIRRVFDTVARERGWPRYDDWYELTVDVVHLEQATDAIVTRARVSRDEPWNLYKLTLEVRDRWVTWRRAEAYRAWEKDGKLHDRPFDDTLEDFGLPDLAARLGRVLDGLRWLVSRTRATL